MTEIFALSAMGYSHFVALTVVPAMACLSPLEFNQILGLLTVGLMVAVVPHDRLGHVEKSQPVLACEIPQYPDLLQTQAGSYIRNMRERVKEANETR